MEITEVRLTLCGEERLKAFANVTFDNEFVVRGLKVIDGNSGFFVSMPARQRGDGSHQDVCHPINSRMREKLERAILSEYERALNSATQEPFQRPILISEQRYDIPRQAMGM